MNSLIKISTAAFVVILIGAGFYFKTPSPARFDREAAIEAGGDYNPRIIRDAMRMWPLALPMHMLRMIGRRSRK